MNGAESETRQAEGQRTRAAGGEMGMWYKRNRTRRGKRTRDSQKLIEVAVRCPTLMSDNEMPGGEESEDVWNVECDRMHEK